MQHSHPATTRPAPRPRHWVENRLSMQDHIALIIRFQVTTVTAQLRSCYPEPSYRWHHPFQVPFARFSCRLPCRVVRSHGSGSAYRHGLHRRYKVYATSKSVIRSDHACRRYSTQSLARFRTRDTARLEWLHVRQKQSSFRSTGSSRTQTGLTSVARISGALRRVQGFPSQLRKGRSAKVSVCCNISQRADARQRTFLTAEKQLHSTRQG
jgi:hypothetical protein